jgi:hypothetical protein
MQFASLLPLWVVVLQDTPYAKLLRPLRASQPALAGLDAMPVARPSALDSVVVPGRFAMLRLKPPALQHSLPPLLKKE